MHPHGAIDRLGTLFMLENRIAMVLCDWVFGLSPRPQENILLNGAVLLHLNKIALNV